MTCPICNNNNTHLLFELTNSNKIFRCDKCTVQLLYPQLNDETLSKLYSENYYKAWGIQGENENHAIKKMKVATFKLRLNAIKKFISSGNILDVGCATGFFLEAAKEQGFVPYGIEISEYSAAISKKKFGNNQIFCGTIETAPLKENSFDAITMSDLIEHVRNPIQSLSKAEKLLKNNGVIMIMTPNSNSVSNRLMKKKWTHYKLEHFFYFNKKSISVLAESCGLEVVYFEKSKKAMNIDYLYTQFNVYPHWLFTPFIKLIKWVLPLKATSYNFYISIGEMVTILKKKNA